MSREYLGIGLLAATILHTNTLWADGISYTGATGTLFLPTASIAEQGKLMYQFNNFGEQVYEDRYSKTYNHLVTIGIAPFLEIGGRLTEYYNPGEVQDNGINAGRRDLSANVKLKLPNIGYGMPDFAIGANDIAGQAVHFRSQYVVGTKQIGNAAISLGYAFGDDPQMNGEFGSIQYDLTDSLSLMGEYVSDTYNVGARYDLGRLLKVPVAVTASKAFESNQDDVFVGLTVAAPLGSDRRNQQRADSTTLVFPDVQENLPAFVSRLAQLGLESVSVGETSSGELVVAFENKLYKHNYMDALGLVAGTALEYVGHNRMINLVTLDNRLSKLVVRFPLVSLKEYFSANTAQSKQRLSGLLRAWYPGQSYFSANKVKWVQGLAVTNRTRFDLMLQPKITTAIGTEWSDGDYSAAVRADVEVPVWRGGQLHVAASEPVANSTLFDDGRVFAQSRQQGGLKEALIQQTFKPSANSAVMASAGLMDVSNDLYYTLQSEALLSNAAGTRQLYAKVAAFEPKDDGESTTVSVASVRQALPAYGVSGEIGYGRFFEDDEGLTLDLTRHFGSADVSTYLKVLSEDEVEGGLRLSLPLSPRKAFKQGGVVVRGNTGWSYSQNTTLEDPEVSGGNPIRLNRLRNPTPQNNLRAGFYDRNRLSPADVRANIARLREAYISLK